MSEIPNLKRVNIRVNNELYNFLKQSADARGLSMNAMCILALESYLQQQTVSNNLEGLLQAWQQMKDEEANKGE